MSVKPNPLKDHNPVLGKGNNVNQQLNLMALNILQKTPYTINNLMYSMLDDILKEPEDDMSELDKLNRKNAFIQKSKQTNHIVDYLVENGNRFFFRWAFDKRGRVYSKGYHCNLQADSYRKAIIEFHNKKKLNAVGRRMLRIDIGNQFGLDKEKYSTRIAKANEIIAIVFKDGRSTDRLIKEYMEESDCPELFAKAMYAWKEGVILGNPIGHNMGMDATASGIQILSALACCPIGARNSNIHPNKDGVRMDPYTLVTNKMVSYLPKSEMFDGLTYKEIRKLIKPAVMTTFYNSKAEPIKVFGEDTEELEVFYEVLHELFPGAMDIIEMVNDRWDSNALHHKWKLFDGHVSFCKVVEKVDTIVKVSELDDAKISYRFYPNQPSDNYNSLMPNMVHSLDAWIVRALTMLSEELGFDFFAIHDDFEAHPNDQLELRKGYNKCMAKIAKSNFLDKFLGYKVDRDSDQKKFAKKCLKAEYSIC